MAITSIDIDQEELQRAKAAAGTSTNRETVDLALRTLTAVRTQPAAVKRLMSIEFDDDQVDAPTITPSPEAVAAAETNTGLAKHGRVVRSL